MANKRRGSVLSIETGYSCNALCGFCPQVTFRLRSRQPEKTDETTEELKARIKQGAEEGYSQLGFSGGEPTIRDDFIELVRYGKSLGYNLIAVTTNGFRLSYMSYAKALVEAGLNSVNISIHGATAKTHNGMMRTPNAFELAIKGINNLQKLERVLGQRIHLMSMCLAAPQVLKEFPEHVRLMGQLGIRLHMIQPLLINPGNANFSDRMMSSYPEIAAAIREGTEIAKAHDGHIKLFNTPVCMLWDIEEHLERQTQNLDVAKIDKTRLKQARRLKPEDGYYQIDACETCIEPCNGFRIEYYPQDKMLEDIQTAMAAAHKRNPSQPVWLGGTELLAPDSWNKLARFAQDLKVSRLSVLSSGHGRTYGEFFSKENLEYIDELSFRVMGRRNKTQTTVSHLQLHGNLEDLEKTLARVNKFEKKPLVSAILSPTDLNSQDIVEFIERTPFNIVRLFCHYTPSSIELMASWPFLKGRILQAANRFQTSGKKVILMSAIKPLMSSDFEWEPFWSRWVYHPWVIPPHPDLTHPFMWNRSQSMRKNILRRPSTLGPAPLAIMPTPPTEIVSNAELKPGIP